MRSEDSSKIAKFWAKTTSHLDYSGDIDDIQWLVTNRMYMAMTLKPKPDLPNGSVQKSHDRKKHIKFIRTLLTVFFDCNDLSLSIRNTTLKLCTDCAKQFIRNAQNCGETNHGFWTIIKHQLTHRCWCMGFWPKTKIVIMPQPPCSPERKFFCDWGDKRKIEARAVGDTKNCVREDWK